MEPENKFEERLRIIKQALVVTTTNTLSSSTRDNVERAKGLLELAQNQLGTAHRGMDLVAQRGRCATVEEAVEACQQYFDTLRSCAQNINSMESRLGLNNNGTGDPCTLEELVEWAAVPLQKRLLEAMLSLIYDDHFCYVEGAVNGTNGSITLINFIKLLAGEWRRDTLKAVVGYMNTQCANGYLGMFCQAVQKRLYLLLGNVNHERLNGDQGPQLDQFKEALQWFECHCVRDKVLQTRQYRAALVCAILRYLKSRNLKEDHERGNHEHAKKLLRMVPRIAPLEMCWVEKELDEYITELRKAKRQAVEPEDDRAILKRFIQWHDTPTKQPGDMSLDEFCESLREHTDYIMEGAGSDHRALYFEYVESFDTHYELCAECTHQSLHAILVKLNQLLRALSCIKKERPLLLSERQKDQYLSVASIFLADIELSREGIEAPCLCCGVAYQTCIEELLVGDQSPLSVASNLIKLDARSHVATTLQQLRVLIRLPSIEKTLWGDDDVMNVERCGDDNVIDVFIGDEADDGLTIGHFDTEEEDTEHEDDIDSL